MSIRKTATQAGWTIWATACCWGLFLSVLVVSLVLAVESGSRTSQKEFIRFQANIAKPAKGELPIRISNSSLFLTQLTFPQSRDRQAFLIQPTNEPTHFLQTPPSTLDPLWIPLIDKLTADGFDRQRLIDIFAELGPRSFSPDFMGAKLTELFKVGNQYINARIKGDPLLPADYVQPISSLTAGNCKLFMDTYKTELADIQRKYGVPGHVLMGILLVETGLGTNLGNYSAFQALASMAATTSTKKLTARGKSIHAKYIPAPVLHKVLSSKSRWAYEEVKALLSHAEGAEISPASIPGSMYGAIGLCQFMPSNINRFGVDGDKDGVINLFSPVDALYSIASYLEQNGWRGAKSSSHKMQVIFTYNHDWNYASKVLAVSEYVNLAQKGKVSQASNPLGVAFATVGVRAKNGGYIDPYLTKRNRGVVTKTISAAPIQGLGSYVGLVN